VLAASRRLDGVVELDACAAASHARPSRSAKEFGVTRFAEVDLRPRYNVAPSEPLVSESGRRLCSYNRRKEIDHDSPLSKEAQERFTATMMACKQYSGYVDRRACEDDAMKALLRDLPTK
jgi:hypothetical protein